MQRDFDGTPMVTDMMTEREVVAFARALRKIGRGTTQITGPLETAAIIARESGRPIIWNALGVSGSVNQHGEMEYPHRIAIERLRQLNEEEGVRVFAQASTVRFRSEICLEEYNLMDMFPAWREACLGTRRGEDRQVRRSRAARGSEGRDQADRWRVRRRPVPARRDEGQLDLHRRPQCGGAEGALRGLDDR